MADLICGFLMLISTLAAYWIGWERGRHAGIVQAGELLYPTKKIVSNKP